MNLKILDILCHKLLKKNYNYDDWFISHTSLGCFILGLFGRLAFQRLLLSSSILLLWLLQQNRLLSFLWRGHTFNWGFDFFLCRLLHFFFNFLINWFLNWLLYLLLNQFLSFLLDFFLNCLSFFKFLLFNWLLYLVLSLLLNFFLRFWLYIILDFWLVHLWYFSLDVYLFGLFFNFLRHILRFFFNFCRTKA